MYRVFFCFLLALVASASAQSSPILSSYPVPSRIAADIGSMADDIMLAKYGNSTPGKIVGSNIQRLLPQAGKFVRWGGAYVIAPTVINSALTWAFNEAKNAANPPMPGSLGHWWNQSATYSGLQPKPFVVTPEISMLPTGQSCFGYSFGKAYLYYIVHHPATAYHVMRAHINSGQIVHEPTSSNNTIEVKTAELSQLCSTLTPQRTLNDIANESPSVAVDLKKILEDYVNHNPNAVRPTLSPVANSNQWEDNPYADKACNTDTDGDGYSDCVEFENQKSGGDVNDKLKKPGDVKTDKPCGASANSKRTVKRVKRKTVDLTKTLNDDCSTDDVEIEIDITVISTENYTTIIKVTITTKTHTPAPTPDDPNPAPKIDKKKRNDDETRGRDDDKDGIPNEIDPDDDDDGIPDDIDPHPRPSDPEADDDDDGIPNKDDPDCNKKTLCKNSKDNCRDIPGADCDDDGVPNNEDDDDDGDDIPDDEETEETEPDEEEEERSDPAADASLEEPDFQKVRKAFEEGKKELSKAFDDSIFDIEFPDFGSVSGGACKDISLDTSSDTLGKMTLGVCDSPAADWMSSTGRDLILYVLATIAVFTAFRILVL